ncbi:Protease 4 [Phycisphaerae bacterium RAS1]|nr:Protease 4 [Phycisphaerae bacterium RAS1]
MRVGRSRSFRWVVFAGVLAALPQLALAEKKVLRLRFDGPLLEAPRGEMDFSVLFGGEKAQTLHKCVSNIHKAAGDKDIAAIVMIVESPMLSFAQIEEVSAALKAFRASGKKIYCYLDYAGNGSYALACAADHITLAEYSELAIAGLHAEVSFYKGLLDKIGVEAEMLHCGDYKAALEPYTRTEPSKAFAENINWLLDGIYDRWVNLMAEGRNLKVDEIKAAVDAAPIDSQEALKKKLVDAVAPFTEFKRMIQKEFGKDVKLVKKYEDEDGIKLDFENPFAIFQMFGEMMEKASQPTKPGVGLIVIEGGIVMGRSEPDFMSGSSSAGSSTLRAAFEKARTDEGIKAVVVRVNSPGGSALASDIIWEAATRCAKEKPVIVSMGSVAGSGGYYVSIPADTIFADETTITASIGVVGGKLVWSGLFEGKLGITTTEFNRGKRASLMSANRKWTTEERGVIEKYMNDVYDQFKGRIKTSRGDRIKGNLDDMAAGRVFTGKQALERGLVDKIGSLHDALKFARAKADLPADCPVHALPKPRDIGDIFKMLSGEETEDEFEIAAAPRRYAADPVVRAALPLLNEFVPGKVREMMEGLRNLLIVDKERVGCFMPFTLSPR